MKQKFNVTGMTCSACSARVEKCAAALDGMQNATVNLLTNTLVVEYDENKLTAEDIISAVKKSGYGASTPQKPNKIEKSRDKNHRSKLFFNENSPYRFILLHDPTNVRSYGTHDRSAITDIYLS